MSTSPFSALLRRIVPSLQKTVPHAPSVPAVAKKAVAVTRDLFESAQVGPLDPRKLLPPFLRGGVTEAQGPEFVHLGEGWTPQGQGYDAGRGEVLTSYYKDHRVMVSFQDKKSGQETHQVKLAGQGAIPPPSHGGGISTDGEFVYVADTERVYVYSREAMLAAEQTGTAVEPLQVMDVPADTTDPVTGIGLVSNGSYMTVHDGYAYVGGYSADGDGKVGAVWRYALDPDTGAIVESSRQGPIRAPDRAQGIAVVDGALLFTTGEHKLMYQPFDERTFAADIHDRVDIGNGAIDSYAQGLNIIDGELWVTYESGSEKYRDNVSHPREHIQRIPLSELDLKAAGITPGDLEG